MPALQMGIIAFLLLWGIILPHFPSELMMDEKSDDLMNSTFNLLLISCLYSHRVLIKPLAKGETYHLRSRLALPILFTPSFHR
jgi:hypothetical protein